MAKLIGIVGRWLFRHLLALGLVILVLVGAGLLEREIKAYQATRDAAVAFGNSKSVFERDIVRMQQETRQRADLFRNANAAALTKRIQVIDQEVSRLSTGRKSPPDPKRCLLMGGASCDRYFAELKTEVQVKLLAIERNHLASLHQALVVDAGATELERLRRAHARIYAELKTVEDQMASLKDVTPRLVLLNPFSGASANLRHLMQVASQLRGQNATAHAAYLAQARGLDAVRKGQKGLQKIEDQIDQVRQQTNTQMALLQKDLTDNWVANLIDSVNAVVPTAIFILAGIVMTPIGIKGFWYFVIAPIASRRAAISLLPDARGHIDIAGPPMIEADGRTTLSQAAPSITIDTTQELLILPEYLLAAAAQGDRTTRLLLDSAYPMSSMAAGLFGLTCIRTSTAERVTLSATKEPLSEVGLVPLTDGSPMVFQPRRLIGVVQHKGRPIRISSHWRLGSLNAWLTLQLRYLVFHGPGTLVVKGCRGVICEGAGQGRSINQSATMGFSASLSYSVTRCEAFGAYLMGKQELFNDSFSGQGCLVYETLPHGGTKTGLFGRGIDGLADSLLKVMGV